MGPREHPQLPRAVAPVCSRSTDRRRHPRVDPYATGWRSPASSGYEQACPGGRTLRSPARRRPPGAFVPGRSGSPGTAGCRRRRRRGRASGSSPWAGCRRRSAWPGSTARPGGEDAECDTVAGLQQGTKFHDHGSFLSQGLTMKGTGHLTCGRIGCPPRTPGRGSARSAHMVRGGFRRGPARRRRPAARTRTPRTRCRR
jgi:hypothetical protein